MNIVVYQTRLDGWGATITDRSDDDKFKIGPYETEDKAKLAAFDRMLFLKDNGWGQG